jgi:tetratricopeptide (TPR) repeat protein
MAINNGTAMLLLLVAAQAAGHEAATPAQCAAAGQQPPIVAARDALDENPTDLRRLLGLADAWSEAGCFNDALTVLQAGASAHPRDKELQTRLRVARSSVSEQHYFDNMDRAAEDAKLSRAAFRCDKLTDVAACDEALALRPNDVSLLLAKGTALQQLKRPSEAILVYRNAAAGGGRSEPLAAKLAQAEVQRQGLLTTCNDSGGDQALHACEAGLLRGSADEPAVLRRLAILLQDDNQPARALDYYMALARVSPGDPGAALAIVSLSDSTGRRDPVTLQARGSALLALKRPADAVAPLKEAIRLAPELADARAKLKVAELASASVAQSAPVARSVPHAERVEPAPARIAVNTAPAPAQQFSNEAPVSQTN